jgi:hypothetical protein
METIKNYLESMFANLPDTLEIRQAKEELYGMMEDKYTELINEGKPQNEAIGIVISEFGNLDELAEGLGINKAINEFNALDRRYVSRREAEDYIFSAVCRRFYLALGIMFCICAPVGPIIFAPITDFFHLALFEGIGVVLLFLCAAIGVGLIVFSGFTMKEWKFIDEELCTIDADTAAYVRAEKEANESSRGMLLALGIMLCIASVIPVIFLSMIFSKIPFISDGIGPSMIFVLAGIGVMMIVFSSSKNSACKKLLSLNNITEIVRDEDEVKEVKEVKEVRSIGSVVEKSYTKDDKGVSFELKVDTDKRSNVSRNSTANTIISSMVASYWKSVLCIYLILSFVTMNWGFTWIIWPLAGLFRGPLESIFGNNSNG